MFLKLYNYLVRGMTYNRELEIYYDDFTYGIVTYGELWQLWKDKESVAYF